MAISELITMGDILKYEAGEQALYARDKITLISGQNLVAGAVLGKVSIGAATSAAKSGGNTGNGTLVVDASTPVLVNAMTGVYAVRAITAGTNSATFRVTGPTGLVLGDVSFSGSGASGTFADRIKFAVTDGSTDFVVGDGFDVTVAAGSSKWTQLSLTATDGSQLAAGVLLVATNATAGDTVTVAAARNCIVPDNRIVWPGGITAPQKTAAIEQLAVLGIILRVGV